MRKRKETEAAGLKEGEPSLFYSSLMLIRSSGLAADYGTITSGEEHFYAWKTLYPRDDACLDGLNAQQQLIAGMLTRANLLQILRTRSVFMDTDGGPRVKVVCRYQQFRAANKILVRLRDGSTVMERSGVVWHTQGSGKSLTMVFLARMLRASRDLADYKIVLVNDRQDLEEQLGETKLVVNLEPQVVGSSATWEKWWHGLVDTMHVSSLDACNRASARSTRWRELPHTGSAIQRHLASLDVMLEQDVTTRQRCVADCLNVIQKAWLIFYSVEPLDDMQTTLSKKLLAGESGEIVGTATYAGIKEFKLRELGWRNSYVDNFPAPATQACNPTSSEGMLLYLLALTTHPEDLQPDIESSLTFDLASCIALTLADPRSSIAGKRLAFVTGQQLWDHFIYTDSIHSISSLDEAMFSGISWRQRYYEELAAVGISFEDIHDLVGPVKVFGEEDFLRSSTKPSALSEGHIPLLTPTNQVLLVDMRSAQIFAPDRNGKIRPTSFNNVGGEVALLDAIFQVKARAKSLET